MYLQSAFRLHGTKEITADSVAELSGVRMSNTVVHVLSDGVGKIITASVLEKLQETWRGSDTEAIEKVVNEVINAGYSVGQIVGQVIFSLVAQS
jgi:hypothetical protein